MVSKSLQKRAFVSLLQISAAYLLCATRLSLLQEIALTIEGMATKILYDVLPSACKILDDVGLFTSGPNLSKLFLSLQSIMNMMNDLKAMPFVGKYIPSISAKCQEVFLNFTTRVILDGSTEKIPQMVCSTTSIERTCVKELETELQEIDFIKSHLPQNVISTFVDLLPSGCAVYVGQADTSNFIANALPKLLDAAWGAC